MKHYKSALVLIAALGLSACDKQDENIDNDATGETVVTETVLDDVDSSEGTISDAMINVEGLDESTDTPEDADGATDGDGAEDSPDDGPDDNAVDSE